MKKIAFIGCGGINSWAIECLEDVTKTFDKSELIYVKLFDNDIVEEKNILRNMQNFLVEDIMEQKAEVLAKRFKFDFENVFITEENISLLDNFDDIIMGVDNHKTRRILYKYCLEKDKYLLDLRAQGTQMAFYVLDHKKDIAYYDEKFFSNKQLMERKGSCQLTNDVENDNIQTANRIIAYMGIYGIYLNHLRGHQAARNEWQFVY